MNRLDKQYTDLLQAILDYGVEKNDRTGTGTKSIFGYTIRHKMSDGFPLLTTKKMYFKGIVTELLWFLRGDTNIKFLVDNDCNIWTGDAYKNYCNQIPEYSKQFTMSKDDYINKIKTDDEFAKKWGELGPIYGKQWRSWVKYKWDKIDMDYRMEYIDQIANIINDLETNPDSRRLLVNSWNCSDLESMVLPPCHYGFQVYTRELSYQERLDWMKKNRPKTILPMRDPNVEFSMDEFFRPYGVPKRAISLMYNCRSQDVPLGTPFNIASYGLLLEIIAKEVNMVPDELIGNLGDCHIYLNQIEGVKEQLGRELTQAERTTLFDNGELKPRFSLLPNKTLDEAGIPKRTREPFDLPTLKIIGNEPSIIEETQYWKPEDFIIENYKSHPKINFPLSN